MIFRQYMVVAKCGANAYYLMDWHSHKLVWSVPGSQLVHFYERAKYKIDCITSEIEPMNTNVESVESDDDKNSSLTCQRVFSKIPSPKTSTPKNDVPSQIAIISSKELQMSSDDSSTTSTIDVGIESVAPVNPWGDMDVKDIPIEIVDHFSDSEDSVQVYDSTPKTQVIFKPLTDDDRQIAALKFNLVITGKTHWVKFTGIDKMSIHRLQNWMALAYSIAFPCC